MKLKIRTLPHNVLGLNVSSENESQTVERFLVHQTGLSRHMTNVSVKWSLEQLSIDRPSGLWKPEKQQLRFIIVQKLDSKRGCEVPVQERSSLSHRHLYNTLEEGSTAGVSTPVVPTDVRIITSTSFSQRTTEQNLT
ncbi:unnamed protein product [Pleuronectes platessa]|uniref:Uncharacterized protein n=1 Tax=Pleuronectes platessa TaxID=8262 RepID=A0A9N7UK19_PLEPL|nr:unnamed protein product [Pleuronectes platessa]